MLCAQCGFKHGKGATEKRARLFCMALCFVEHAEVIDRQGHLDVVATEDFFFDGQGATVHRLGLREIPACLMQRGEIVEVHGDLVMLGAIHTVKDGQGAVIQRLGFGAFALPVEQGRQCGDVERHVGMVRP